MKALTIKVHKIDWLKVINLAFKKKDWGKTYTLYQYKDLHVDCTMTDFNFPRQTARFEVRCHYSFDGVDYNETQYTNYITVEYFLQNFTIKDFSSLVIRRVQTLLNDIIRRHTRDKAEAKYNDLHYSKWGLNSEERDELIVKFELQEDWDIIQKIDNEYIQDNCADEFISILVDTANEPYDREVSKELDNLIYVKNVSELALELNK